MIATQITGPLPISDYPIQLAQIITHTSLGKLKAQPEYYQSKYLASSISAYRMCGRLIKKESLESIKSMVDPYKKTFIVPVQQAESHGYNVIPLGLAYQIQSKLGYDIADKIYRWTGHANTGATIRDRASNKIRFMGKIPIPGSQYIIVDDNYTSGSTVKALADLITKQGGELVCITTLSASRYGKSFLQSDAQISALQKIPNSKNLIQEFYAAEQETLTGAQIQAFLFYTSKFKNTYQNI